MSRHPGIGAGLWDTTDDGTDYLASISNPRNSAGADAIIQAVVGGTSAGDAAFRSVISGGGSAIWGCDNSTGTDDFVVSLGSVLGVNNVLIASATGSVGTTIQESTGSGRLKLDTSAGTELRFTPDEKIVITSVDITLTAGAAQVLKALTGGDIQVGTGALATGATSGFLMIPASAGAPTGAPTIPAGMVALHYDSTNNRWYVRSGGTWRSVAVA